MLFLFVSSRQVLSIRAHSILESGLPLRDLVFAFVNALPRVCMREVIVFLVRSFPVKKERIQAIESSRDSFAVNKYGIFACRLSKHDRGMKDSPMRWQT